MNDPLPKLPARVLAVRGATLPMANTKSLAVRFLSPPTPQQTETTLPEPSLPAAEGVQFSEIEIDAMKIADESGWYPWIFVKKADGVHCTGAVCPLKTRGPKAGYPNYRRHDPDTKRTVVVPFRQDRV